jgi:sulfate permease, SulP family
VVDYWLQGSALATMLGLVVMTMAIVYLLPRLRKKVLSSLGALGAANIVAGAFKGMGGCALVGESLINTGSGGRGQMSCVIASLALLAFILVGAPLIDRIPIAALTGVMFVVVIAAVTTITVWHDLAVAVISGVILSALVFSWNSAKHVRFSLVDDSEKKRICRLEALLYFGLVRDFTQKFDPAGDPSLVVLDFHEARACDLSSLEAIRELA